MAFDAINTAETLPGQPTKTELFTKTKDNFDDHESRLAVSEASLGRFAPAEFAIVGPTQTTDADLVKNEVLTWRVPFDITVLGTRLLILSAGASGSTEIELEVKQGVAAFTTILASPVSVAFGAGNYALGSASLGALTELDGGDIVRLNVNAVQEGGESFTVYMEYASR